MFLKNVKHPCHHKTTLRHCLTPLRVAVEERGTLVRDDGSTVIMEISTEFSQIKRINFFSQKKKRIKGNYNMAQVYITLQCSLRTPHPTTDICTLPFQFLILFLCSVLILLQLQYVVERFFSGQVCSSGLCNFLLRVYQIDYLAPFSITAPPFPWSLRFGLMTVSWSSWALCSVCSFTYLCILIDVWMS